MNDTRDILYDPESCETACIGPRHNHMSSVTGIEPRGLLFVNASLSQ